MVLSGTNLLSRQTVTNATKISLLSENISLNARCVFLKLWPVVAGPMVDY